MSDPRGPLPRAPRKFVRDIEHGHHRECDCSLEAMYRDERHVCTCDELDEDDYIAAECERRYDAWKDGDYTERSEQDE